MRHDRFTFLCNAEERRILATLAQRLQRSQSDAVRLVIREAVHSLDTTPTATQPTTPTADPQPCEVRP
jgi:hypothetical protein